MADDMGVDRFEKKDADAFAQLPSDLALSDVFRQERQFDRRPDPGCEIGAFDHAAGRREIAHGAAQADIGDGDAHEFLCERASLASAIDHGVSRSCRFATARKMDRERQVRLYPNDIFARAFTRRLP